MVAFILALFVFGHFDAGGWWYIFLILALWTEK